MHTHATLQELILRVDSKAPAAEQSFLQSLNQEDAQLTGLKPTEMEKRTTSTATNQEKTQVSKCSAAVVFFMEVKLTLQKRRHSATCL